MPLVRIDHAAGKSAAYRTALSQGVDDAMVATFNVTFDDHFHVIAKGDWIRDLTAAGSKRAIAELMDFQSRATSRLHYGRRSLAHPSSQTGRQLF
jgi:hypothetical protein